MNSIDARVRLVHGDITTINADAIVTAANEALCGGGGVDGAVHDAAGRELVRASMALAPCPSGDARLTEGFDLNARFVIHAVGPIFRNLDLDSPILARAYRSALSLAADHAAASVAFPCISTGVFGFPPDAACDIAIETVLDWLSLNDLPQVVIFCCFESRDNDRYRERLNDRGIVV